MVHQSGHGPLSSFFAISSRYLDVRARVVRARFRAFSYCIVQYELNKMSRFYALTPKITYSLGRFLSCCGSAVPVTW